MVGRALLGVLPQPAQGESGGEHRARYDHVAEWDHDAGRIEDR
jgi:hypothetical protein